MTMASNSLLIEKIDFNEALRDLKLIKRLRNLTLCNGSGMNCEISNLSKIALQRRVDACALLAFLDKKLVGWALLSKENSNFYFMPTPFKHHETKLIGFVDGNFNGDSGILFQVFVAKNYRGKGIGTALFSRAKKSKEKLFISPWDENSTNFFFSILY
jgi:GNAT superfamily N-acetyltransferase